ncbi:alpha/beta fold hydrolase [Pseudahrensia aquimaris]|uniref:Alpha/beta fold hydrolase n=1 Tax=Pseudahrensia aquimaris TaxID=744461 RepID=A0ABW3FAU5_9HYPH
MEQDAKKKLISEIYEVVLDPNRYDHFMGLWDDYMEGQLPALIEDYENDRINPETSHDPEIAEHFQRSFEIMERLSLDAKTTTTVKKLTDGNDMPTMVFDRLGNVVGRSDTASDFFGPATRLQDISDAFEPTDLKELATLITRVESSTVLQQSCVVRLTSRNHLEALEPNNERSGIAIAKPQYFEDHDRMFTVLTTLEVPWSKQLESVLERTFQITSSEAEILRGLCRGIAPNDLADLRARSRHTVRAQVKTLLRKTGCRSQSDLVQLTTNIASHVAKVGNVPVGMLREQFLNLGTITHVQVDKEFSIPVHEIGPADGKPVFFIHGVLDGVAVIGFLTRLLNRAGIRLIAPVRPAFGSCPSRYEIKTAPTEFADDLIRIMDWYEIPRAPIIGHMSGALFAFAAAKRHPGRVQHVLSVSGGVPIVSMKQMAMMNTRQRIVALTAKLTPSLLKPILRAGISQLRNGDEDKFMRSLYVEGSPDWKLISDHPDIRAAIKEGYDFAVAQGHRGFEIDASHVTRDWSEFIDGLQCKATQVHGIHDPVVRIESVRETAERYPHLELIELEKCGQLLFYDNPQLILSLLKKLCAEPEIAA